MAPHLPRPLFERAEEAARALAPPAELKPAIGLVLGSGLSGLAERVEVVKQVPYAQLPHFLPTQVEGHPGNLVLGRLAGVPVVILAGRLHGYEGHPPQDVAFGVRVLAALGVHTLVQTNAAGGVDRRLGPGSLMAIADHINLTGQNVLLGPHDPRLGPRFLDLTYAYSARLRRLWRQAAEHSGVHLTEGTYAAVLGPNYETPAEVTYLAGVGAQAVGMSTVHETVAARHAGLEVAGLSVITNAAAGYTPHALSHAEVTDTGRGAAERVWALLEAFFPLVAVREAS